MRVDPHHLHASTQQSNMQWAVSTGRLVGNKPGAAAAYSRVERSRRIRRALSRGWDEQRFRNAIAQPSNDNQYRLF
ncbi:MAG: hypothetical protein SOW59_08545 [Corynebacterium sp.]|nr:hypothetical protein [Corynebacterium sp.]